MVFETRKQAKDQDANGLAADEQEVQNGPIQQVDEPGALDNDGEGPEQAAVGAPRRRRQYQLDVSSSDSDSEDSVDDDDDALENLNFRRSRVDVIKKPAGSFDSVNALKTALEARKASKGCWAKHVNAFSASEAVLQSQSIAAFETLTGLICALPKQGGSALESHLSSFKSLVTSWKSVNTSLKHRRLSKSDLEEGLMVSSASLDLVRDFMDKYSSSSTSPAAIAGIVAFVEDPIATALLGKDSANEICSGLKSFIKVNRSLAACSFSSLLKWRAKNEYRQSSSKRSFSSGQGTKNSSNGAGSKNPKKSRF